MKHSKTIVLMAVFLLMLSLASCNPSKPSEDTGTSLPDTIETLPTTEPGTDPGINPPDTPTVSSVNFPAAQLPDYAKYATANRIKEVLGSRTTYAFTLGGTKYYANGELKAGGEGIVSVNSNGNVTVDAAKLGEILGKSGLSSNFPQVIASNLKMGYSIYDHKLVLFFDGEEPLDTFEDLYTYEAMHLYMTDAPESEIVNAFIDLPDRISNDTNNTIFYTAPDLNLGIQTSIYFAQMGQMNNLATAPALVAGEGKHADNFTTVRIYNNQNTCTTQFLAFDPSVTGGVQVAAAKVGDEVLIATAPFSAHDGANGDVRVYDTFGLIRMEIYVHDVIEGPYTIVTGHFVEGVADEVLLVASQKTNDKGELHYALISLSDGKVISEHKLDCSFALSDNKAGVPVALSVRNLTEGVDPVILYFNSVQAVYEGNASQAKFDNAGITLPADATGVSASTVNGQKYLVALPAREGQEAQSYMTVYDGNATVGKEMDMGFMENRFYSSLDGAKDLLEYNDDKYVSKGLFCHLRTEYSNMVHNGLSACKTNKDIDAFFDNSTYADYTVNDLINEYTKRLSGEYLMLEPAFTARWHKTGGINKLAKYLDPYTGEQKYLAYGPDGKWSMEIEVDPNYFYTGTYADGILELEKFNYYPLRSFLQATAVSFRGEGANPQHLVGISPVHEMEVAVATGVGDYNPYMLEGFRIHMLERYGTVENINATFGTDFSSASAIDAPRNTDRGAWDKYRGEYFTEWVMYNRYIISKRIMEAYREALLAGYPAESITAHQIPEAEAIAGFLGSAETRLSPIDTVLTCGTGYGGTRYGTMNINNNIAYNAHLMGHSNMTLGEYGSMMSNKGDAYKQLKMLWNNGVHMVQQMIFDGQYLESELYAITKLMEENQPRPGYTGGTAGSVSVKIGDKEYNIIQIGSGADSEQTGLLKSIDANGNWEGSVYLVPFHAKMTAKALETLNTPVEGTQNVFTTGDAGTIKNADQVEITFTAAKVGTQRAWVTFEVYHGDCLMPKSVTTYELTEAMTPYRYVLANQLYDDGLQVKVTFHTESGEGSMENIRVENLCGTLQKENVGFAYYEKAMANRLSKAHVGGVTFDLLDR